MVSQPAKKLTTERRAAVRIGRKALYVNQAPTTLPTQKSQGTAAAERTAPYLATSAPGGEGRARISGDASCC